MPHPEGVAQLVSQNVDGAEARRGVGDILARPLWLSPELRDQAAERLVAHGSSPGQPQRVVLWISPAGVEQVDPGQVDAEVPVPGAREGRVQAVVVTMEKK